MKKGYSVAVIGATGAVGQELLAILEERAFPVGELTAYASERSFGKTVEFKHKEYDITVLTEESVKAVDFAFFSSGATISKAFAPLFAAKGAFVIDKSSAFRMDKDIPLIVPEVNGHLLRDLKKGSIVANPNCSTIQLVPFLKVLHDGWGLKRVVVSTYQSVSGAGQKGIEELHEQVTDLFASREFKPKVFPQRIAFNIIPHIDKFHPDGYTEEEKKLMAESRKILDLPSLDIDATAARVPVFYSHSESVLAELEREVDLTDLRTAIEDKAGLSLMDDFESLLYPTPADAAGKDDIFIGRLRYGGGTDKHRINAWVVADNIRKGAALNGVQIAETIIGEQIDA